MSADAGRSQGVATPVRRRELLRFGLVGAAAAMIPPLPERRRAAIVLWMDGGPSAFDTWTPDCGGQFRSIATRSPGIRYCCHMPELADLSDRIAVVANVSVPEIDHRRARILARNGVALPATAIPVEPLRQVRSQTFADQCRRALGSIERGATYAEAILPGWDTHTDNAPRVRRLLAQMDHAMAELIRGLEERDLLRNTLVLWMGEFGRTREINRAGGRDHDPDQACVAMAGGGIRGGIVLIGRSVPVADVFATAASVSPLYRGRPRVAQGVPIGPVLAQTPTTYLKRSVKQEGGHGLV